jgi:hypothetical protein
VALAACAAALWAVEIPGLAPSVEAPVVPPTAPVTPDAAADEGIAAPDADDIGLIAGGLEMSRRPREIKPTEAAAPPDPTPAATGPAWQYLGSVVEPGRLVALVSIDGRQRMLTEGRRISHTGPDGAPTTLRVVSVLEDAIVVEDSTGQHRIPRKERVGGAVAWLTMPDVQVPEIREVPGRGGAMDLTAEQRQRLIERGIDPEEAMRMREAAMERRARLRGVPERAGETAEVMGEMIDTARTTDGATRTRTGPNGTQTQNVPPRDDSANDPATDSGAPRS